MTPTPDKDPELKACPFCGSKKLYWRGRTRTNPGFVACQDCCGENSSGAWNKRSSENLPIQLPSEDAPTEADWLRYKIEEAVKGLSAEKIRMVVEYADLWRVYEKCTCGTKRKHGNQKPRPPLNLGPIKLKALIARAFESGYMACVNGKELQWFMEDFVSHAISEIEGGE